VVGEFSLFIVGRLGGNEAHEGPSILTLKLNFYFPCLDFLKEVVSGIPPRNKLRQVQSEQVFLPINTQQAQ
jgi:hypothetical protein